MAASPGARYGAAPQATSRQPSCAAASAATSTASTISGCSPTRAAGTPAATAIWRIPAYDTTKAATASSSTPVTAIITAATWNRVP